jgi:ATPase subunit of ABC transporter with duplicated ATPase domains
MEAMEAAKAKGGDDADKAEGDGDDDDDDPVSLKKKSRKDKKDKKEKKKDKKKEKKSKNEDKQKGNTAAAADDDDADDPPPPTPPPPTNSEPAAPRTLEEVIRKTRPPPSVRILTSTQPNYISLGLSGVTMIYKDQQVLSDASWFVATGDRVGLVGANGCGKTTMLKILNDDVVPTTGDVVKSSKEVTAAVLRQEFVDDLDLTRTLREELLSVFQMEQNILRDLRDTEAKLESCTEADSLMQETLDRLQSLQQQADASKVYTLTARIDRMLNQMGFTDAEGDSRVGSFSGGWKMRIGLGKVLLKDPNVLLLDEPTNHLDLESVEWLEHFLIGQKIPMVIVSHDREFLDRVCTKIVDTDAGVVTSYDGNYSRFLQLKAERMKAWQSRWDDFSKKVDSERTWIQKFRNKLPDAVKQRQAKLDRMLASPDAVKKPPNSGKPFKFRFPKAPRLSDEIAVVEELTHGYFDSAGARNQLFDKARFVVERGDRYAILGPNGSGKSTLLRLVLGSEAPSEGGTAGLKGMNVVANYFEQNQADVLDLDKTVMEIVEDASDNHSHNELRAVLGQFMFKGDSVAKKVKQLSGGEKARLSLCTMMLRPANVLILDEPTNHLDIPAKEMLEEALQNFDGSIVVVSHDRFFISRIATSIAAIEDKKIAVYGGDYKFYMEHNQQLKEKVQERHVVGSRGIGNAVVVEEEDKKRFGGRGGPCGNLMKGIKNAKRGCRDP